MLKSVLLAVVLVLPAAGQDPGRISRLLEKLDDPDWVEQARAAKELSAIGQPVVDSLRQAALTESPAKRYWASMIADEIFRRDKGSAGAGTLPAAPSGPAPEVGMMNFGQGENDLGSIMFICNNAKHGDYEVVLSRCPTCAKAKRFTVDYRLRPAGFRCTVCGKPYGDYKCDQCGSPPGSRTRVKLKR
jgi:hypothetical protein